MAAIDPDIIARLRRMVQEPTTATYSDAVLWGYVEAHPLYDELGAVPFTWTFSTVPPSKVLNASWIATYDLNAAAAEVWEEKAGAVAHRFDFSADGGNFSASQAYTQANQQAARYRSKRAARAVKISLDPPPGGAWRRDQVIGNLPEEP